jgi:hypothetical protein
MSFDGLPQSFGDALESHVPRRARAVHHRMQEPRFKPQSLTERGAFGTEAAGIGRVAFIAGDGRSACSILYCHDAAANAAIWACCMNTRRLRVGVH